METKSQAPAVTTIWLIELREGKKEISKAAAHPGMLSVLFKAKGGKQGSKKCKQIYAWGNLQEHNPLNDLSV